MVGLARNLLWPGRMAQRADDRKDHRHQLYDEDDESGPAAVWLLDSCFWGPGCRRPGTLSLSTTAEHC